jgi:hypothetical protein
VVEDGVSEGNQIYGFVHGVTVAQMDPCVDDRGSCRGPPAVEPTAGPNERERGSVLPYTRRFGAMGT